MPTAALPHPLRPRGSALRASRWPVSEALSRFVFGPPAHGDPGIDEEWVLALLRGQGRAVAPADVMRATGLDRRRAEALLCQAVARFGGEIEVAGTAVVYRLSPRPGSRPPAPAPVWERPLAPPAVTGNHLRTDLLLFAVNLFLLSASAAALAALFSAGAGWWGLALAPLALSLVTLLLPLGRLLGQRARRRRIARQAGRRRLLRAVLERPAGSGLQAYWLSHAWIEAAGHPIAPAALLAEMVALGGEPDVDADARLLFRFPDLDHEARALAAERRSGMESPRAHTHQH